MADEILAQESVITVDDLLDALDGDDPHRAALLLRWLWLDLDRERKAQDAILEIV